MALCLRSIALVALALCASVAGATYHTYQIDEIYSNADGTVQYVVLHEALGMNGQNQLTGRLLTSTGPGGTKNFVFPMNLPGETCGYYGCMPSPTAGTRVLIATQGFVVLGLITPDYVIPNGFLATGGGALNYAGVDQWTYEPLPADGVNALYRTGPVRANLARNFDGDAVSVNLAAATPNYQGLWWNAPANSESGWGLNIAHQADTIFASWFTYDAAGRGWWLVMTAQKSAPNVYTGTLYQTHGPPFSAQPFNPANVTSTPVGTGTLSFTDANNGTFTYTLTSPAVTQTKSITREVFGPLPTCTFGSQPSLASATNYQDLWWAAPAASESGWGINLNHEGDSIFATWFTYDIDGTPLWLVVTAPKTGPGVYGGDLYRTAGARFDAFNPASVVPTKVGTATFTFADGNNASFDYTVQLSGMTSAMHQTKTITREIFTAPGTTCQ